MLHLTTKTERNAFALARAQERARVLRILVSFTHHLEAIDLPLALLTSAESRYMHCAIGKLCQLISSLETESQ